MVRYFGGEIEKLKNTAYLGNADAYTTNELQLTKNDLYRDIKYGSLFYKHVIFSAAFFWQNKKVNSLMYNLEEYIQYGLVLPSIRNPESSNDILDYVYAREAETSTDDKEILDSIGLGAEIVTTSDIEVAKVISNYNSVLHQEGRSVRSEYKYLFRRDLENKVDSNSIYSILSSQRYRGYIEPLFKLSMHKNFSRSFVLSEISNYRITNFTLKKLGGRLSYLFLKSNSNIYRSDMLISSSKKELYLNPEVEISKGNMYLIKEVFVKMGITPHNIDMLSARDIIIIRESPQFKQFCNTYFNILSTIRDFEESSIDNILRHIVKQKRFDSSMKLISLPSIFFKNVSREIITYLLFGYYGVESAVASNAIIATGYDLLEKLVPKIEIFKKSGIDEFSKYFIEKKFEKESIRLLSQIN